MTNRVRVNLANARELLELIGISESEVETIVRFRAEHGPIADGLAAQRRSRRAADDRRHPRARGLRALGNAHRRRLRAPERPAGTAGRAHRRISGWATDGALSSEAPGEGPWIAQ